MEPNEYIDEMIKVIESRGWCQGETVNKQGNVCIIGASDVVDQLHSFDWRIGFTARGMIRNQIYRDGHFANIPAYNDEIAKSIEDVILLLKKSKVEE